MTRALALSVLVLWLAACQSAPPPPPPPAPASAAVWAQVPRQICTCHEEALGRIETVLADSQLAVEFKIEGGNEGWHIFSVTFDPTSVSPDTVQQILRGAGALIIPAPVAR
jgi:hypothetical protein